MYMASDPSQRNKVSSAFQAAANHGLSIARTWAFSDGEDRPLQYSPGSYNEDMFLGLEFIIAEARRYGTKLVLSLVNNYDNSFGYLHGWLVFLPSMFRIGLYLFVTR
ncbi:hypothetical protein PHAVU_008G135400 [Phaseolus vulgaris]